MEAIVVGVLKQQMESSAKQAIFSRILSTIEKEWKQGSTSSCDPRKFFYISYFLCAECRGRLQAKKLYSCFFFVKQTEFSLYLI